MGQGRWRGLLPLILPTRLYSAPSARPSIRKTPLQEDAPALSLMPGSLGALLHSSAPPCSLTFSSDQSTGSWEVFGRALSIPASLPFAPRHCLANTPFRPRPSGYALLLRKGGEGACLPLHSLAPIGRAAGWGRDCTRARTPSLLTALRLSLKLTLGADEHRSDSNSSSMSDKRQSRHEMSQRVPESFRGESLVP